MVRVLLRKDAQQLEALRACAAWTRKKTSQAECMAKLVLAFSL